MENQFNWTDEAVKEFTKIYCRGAVDEYKNARKVEDKIKVFKKVYQTRKTEELSKAKETLKRYGYFVDNLWCTDDVVLRYQCSEEDAQGVLLDALTNEATME
jgi:hypothetical protein